jgi:hypothetical protein
MMKERTGPGRQDLPRGAAVEPTGADLSVSSRWPFRSIRPDVLRFAVGLTCPEVGDGHGHGHHAVVNAAGFEVESKIYSLGMAKRG